MQHPKPRDERHKARILKGRKDSWSSGRIGSKSLRPGVEDVERRPKTDPGGEGGVEPNPSVCSHGRNKIHSIKPHISRRGEGHTHRECQETESRGRQAVYTGLKAGGLPPTFHSELKKRPQSWTLNSERRRSWARVAGKRDSSEVRTENEIVKGGGGRPMASNKEAELG